MVEKDLRQVMFGKERGSDGTGCIEACQASVVSGQRQPTLRLILCFRMVHCILEIDVGVHQSLGRRCRRSCRATAVVGLRRKVRRDGIGRSGQSSTLASGWERLGRNRSEAFLAGPEGVIPRLGDVHKSRCPAQSHADAGNGFLGVESHYRITSIELFLCQRNETSQHDTGEAGGKERGRQCGPLFARVALLTSTERKKQSDVGRRLRSSLS